MKRSIRFTVFAFICMGVLFASSTRFIDSQLLPKWFVMIGGLLLISCYSAVCFSINSSKVKIQQNVSLQYVTVIIVSTILSQAIYGILQYINILSSTCIFQVVGSFDNPAGFSASLCAGLPFCILGIVQAKKKIRWIFILALALVVVGVILSESRAGILSLVIVLGYWFRKRFRISSFIKRIILFFLLSGVVTGLYYYKKDSADGRLLIWKCSISLLKENLLIGGGTGTFEAHYMDYQAKYFMKHPDSQYAMIADNVQYPFCEYLNIGVNYGIIGLCVVFCIIGYMFRCYYKEQTPEKETAFLCWLNIAISALFSYPLMYPFVWLMLLYSAYLLTQKQIYHLCLHIMKFRLLIGVFWICLLIYISTQTFQRMKAELEWTEISNLALLGKMEETFPRYRKVYVYLKTDRYFLYNYSAELYQAGKYQEGLVIALQCRKCWADYDLEMLLGRLYEQLHQSNKAEQSYRLASHMCPNRFVPLYQLVLLLKKEQRLAEAIQIAKEIINKSEKVHSPIISQIKREMSNLVSNRISH